jgi:hypothetical protein
MGRADFATKYFYRVRTDAAEINYDPDHSRVAVRDR